MAKTFILHDESLNTFGFWIKTSGLVLDQFIKNPTMNFMHIRPGDDGNQGREMLLPIGTWTNIRVEGTQLLADPEFDMDDDFAKRIAGKVEKGILKMASAGITPITWSDDSKLLKPGQIRPTLLKGTMVEASIVDRGSNMNAFQLYDENMQLITLSQDPLKCEVPLIKLTNNYEMKTVFGLLKLADTANEAEAYQAILKLNERLTTLEADKVKLEADKVKLEGDILKLKQGDETAQKEKINTLVDEAVKARKILAANKADYVALAEKDFDNTKKILDGMAPISKLTETGTDVTLAEKYKGKTWKELDKVEGALAEIKLKDPNHFKELFKVEFGKEPTL
jgi:hypothetical protein